MSTLLNRTRAHVGFVLRPAGEQVLANVLHVAELARQYELDGGMSFRGFVDALQDAAAAGQAAEAPILEEGSDGVRLMTVHKAKGLEFPVVILGDITARLTPFDASRYVDTDRQLCALRLGGWLPQDLLDQRDSELLRERAEGERVAYVAATRARDLLVVPAVGDGPYAEGWVAPLTQAIYPDERSRRLQAAGPGCPAFASKDSVRKRPDGDPATGRTVCPGLHTIGGADSAHDVVWWSPEGEALQLDVPASFGLRRDDLIVKDVPASVLKRYRDDYDRWRSGRDAAIQQAAQPSLEVRTVTEYTARPGGSRTQVLPFGPAEVITFDHDADAPRGRRYGTLVHAALATVPLDADAETIRRITATQARIAAASPLELGSAATVVSTVLRHPLLEAARQADAQGRCLRETPVTLVRDGVLIEGVVDLAFETAEGMTVVDFKTDRAEGELLDQYRQQVDLYGQAIAKATGKPVKAVLMRV